MTSDGVETCAVEVLVMLGRPVRGVLVTREEVNLFKSGLCISDNSHN